MSSGSGCPGFGAPSDRVRSLLDGPDAGRCEYRSPGHGRPVPVSELRRARQPVRGRLRRLRRRPRPGALGQRPRAGTAHRVLAERDDLRRDPRLGVVARCRDRARRDSWGAVSLGSSDGQTESTPGGPGCCSKARTRSSIEAAPADSGQASPARSPVRAPSYSEPGWDALEALETEITAAGASVRATVLDVLGEAAVEQHVDEVASQAGSVDISFNLTSREDKQGTPRLEMSVEGHDAGTKHGADVAVRHRPRRGSPHGRPGLGRDPRGDERHGARPIGGNGKHGAGRRRSRVLDAHPCA